MPWVSRQVGAFWFKLPFPADHEDAMSRLSRATPERSRGDVQKEARRVVPNYIMHASLLVRCHSAARCNITFNALPVKRAQVPSQLLT